MSSKTLQKLTNRIESRTLESLGHLLAGGTSGAIALTILYPIEQLNTRSTVVSQARIITWKTIIDDFTHLRIENIADTYRGLSFGIFEKFTFNGIYFFFYSFLKNDWKRKNPTKGEMPMAIALFRGSLAGILTQLFTSPLSTIQKILQTSHSQDRRGASQIITHLSRERGILSLWSGFGMSMILVINPAINMYCYEYIRHYLSRTLGKKSSAIDFFAGLLSKAIATIICYPLIYIKYNQQASTSTGNIPPPNPNGARANSEELQRSGSRRSSAMDLIVDTMQNEGITGFYKGMSSKLVQSSLNNALTFMIKEKVVIYTFAMMLYISNKRKVNMRQRQAMKVIPVTEK